MSLKGKIIYFVLPVFFYVLARMIHQVFYAFIFVYFFYCLKCFSLKTTMTIVLFFIVTMIVFRIPQVHPIDHIEGKVVGVDTNYIVIQDGYDKAKVYGSFENVNIGDKIAVTGTEQEISLPANDHAFHYQHYLYSLNIFHTLKLNQIIYHQKNDGFYLFLQKRVNQNKNISSGK